VRRAAGHVLGLQPRATPSVLARLDAYAAEHRWTRSTAAAVLIEEGTRDIKITMEGEHDRAH
jgi:hypothetical protein